MTQELIERLRMGRIASAPYEPEYRVTNKAELEAADAIERLTAELTTSRYWREQEVKDLTAERDALAKDAARYRFIFAESVRVDPVCALVWKKGEVRNSSEWVNSTGSVWMSKELDEAIAKEQA